MAMNRVQFQSGLSMPEFMDRYGTELQCEEALAQSRWPSGFVCPACGGASFSAFRRGALAYRQCSACRHQCSSIAGTIFESTKLGLTRWFLAMHLLTQAKNNVSALELMRHLGVSYPTAWLVKHKLMDVMRLREDSRQLTGRVEMDDAYLGSELAGGKAGRGSENKVAFIAAVQTTDDGQPILACFSPGPFTTQAVEKFAAKSLVRPLTVVSDGLACFLATKEFGVHERIVTGGGKASAKLPRFKAVNTVLSNLKTAINGTYHAFDFAKYAHRSSLIAHRSSLSVTAPRRAIGCPCGWLRLVANQVEVCRPLSAIRGLYCTHMRNEGDRVVDALEETFRIGRELGTPVVISHHKVLEPANFGRSKETLALIEKRMAEQPVCLDCYPYTAGSTILSVGRLAGARRVIVSWSKTLPGYAGQDLDAIARQMGVSQEEAVERLIPAGAIYFKMDEEDVQRILRFDRTMIGSDGLPHDASPHPRLWGTFPRVLGHYGRLLGLFPLEVAVHKMTGLTAQNFGLRDRGVLKEGAYADLTLFDADTVDEAASYAAPVAPARGIDTVIVNGEIVWRDGRSTGARPGRVLARTAPAATSP